MAEAGHIFLSYRSIEADFALKLAADLKNAGVQLWMDRLDGIQVGMDWRDAIQEAINTCAAVIAVLSPDYVVSEYCKKELARANKLQRSIFPVLLRPVKKEDWPLVIEGMQYEDFTDWLDPKQYTAHLDKLLTRLKTDAAGQVRDTPDAETRYLTKLIAELEAARGVLQYVPLSGQIDRPEPPLEEEWVYLDKLVSKQTRRGEADIPNPREGHEEHVPLANISEAVEKHPRFVLLGEPGAGKTTTIRKLVLEGARKRRDNPRTAPIPLLLYLPQWDKEPTHIDFVRAHCPFTNGDDPLQMLKRGDIRLYLDGLNEMGAAGPHRAKQLCEWFESPDAPAYAIVTCRMGDYSGDLRLGETPTVLVQELDEAKIRQFAEKYIPDRAMEFLARVFPRNKTAHRSPRSLFGLARNPFMLTALTYVYKEGGELPLNIGVLFRALAQELWNRETRRGTTGGITFEQAEATFAQLAFAMIEENTPLDVPEAWALQQLTGQRQWQRERRPDAEKLLRSGVNANYVALSGGRVRFYHQLLQDYFAAILLHQGRFSKKLLSKTLFSEGFPDKKWGGTYSMFCGMASDPDDIVTTIASQNPFLASQCVASGIQVSSATRQRVIELLLDGFFKHANTSSDPFISLISAGQHSRKYMKKSEQAGWELRRRQNYAEALQIIGDTSAIPRLKEALRHHLLGVRDDAARILGEIGDVSTVPDLVQALREEDADQELSKIIAEAISKIGQPAIPFLVPILHDDAEKPYYVRWAAAYALGKIGGDIAVEELVKAIGNQEINKEDASYYIRLNHTISSALVEIGKPALPYLIDTLQDPNSVVGRLRSARILEQINLEIPLSALISRLEDKENMVRIFAQDRIRKIGKPAIPELVRTLHEGNPLSRYSAAEVLGDIAGPDIEGDLIKAYIIHENSNEWPMRWVLADAISKTSGTPGLIRALQDLEITAPMQLAEKLAKAPIEDTQIIIHQLNDFRWYVRACVAFTLGEMHYSQTGPQYLVETIARLLDDNNIIVRYRATEALGKIKNDTVVSKLIKMLEDDQKVFSDSSERICDAAHEALKYIGTPEALNAANEWNQKQNPE